MSTLNVGDYVRLRFPDGRLTKGARRIAKIVHGRFGYLSLVPGPPMPYAQLEGGRHPLIRTDILAKVSK